MKKIDKIINVSIGYNIDKEEIEYIKSDFLDEKYSFKDPIGYTTALIEMALEKWIREKVGFFCPNCELELQEGWLFCPNCGWNSNQ